MGKRRYPKPIIPYTPPAMFIPDPNDPIDKLIARAEAAFGKVSYFPEETPENWTNFITLRNVVPELVRELKYLNRERKKSLQT
jgi:hypothetical protein